MKQGIRIAAFASGPIPPMRGVHGKALVVCVIWRNNTIEGILSSKVHVDGSDATKKIKSAIKRSRFSDQIKLIALNGVAIAGLNVIDLKALTEIGVGVAVVTRTKQRPTELLKAVKLYGEAEDDNSKAQLIKEQSKMKLKVIEGFYVRSSIPLSRYLVKECASALRIAHMIARGIATGESKGRI